MDKDKRVEVLLHNLGILNKKTYDAVLSNPYFVSNIWSNTSDMEIACSALLCGIENYKKSDYFLKNLPAFAHAYETVCLFNEIHDTFNISPIMAVNAATQIFCHDNNNLNFLRNIFQMLEKYTKISQSDAIMVISKNPQFLCSNMKIYYNNLNTLFTKFKIKSATLAYIFNNCPLFFAKNDLLKCKNKV